MQKKIKIQKRKTAIRISKNIPIKRAIKNDNATPP
jgi:hypothetical protein